MSSPSELLLYERSFYVANAFCGVLTGLIPCLSFFAVYFLLQSRSMSRRMKIFYVVYILVILICMIFAFVANAYMGQLMWVDHHGYPGGPFVYYLSASSNWVNVLGSATDIFVNIIGDAFLLYRCYIIWSCRPWVIAFPTLLFLASVVTAMISLVESALPNSSFFQKQTVNFAVPWVSLTSGLNVILTVLISSRILWVRHQVRTAFVSSDPAARNSDMYTSIVAIFVESALPFSVLGIVTAITAGRDLWVSSIFFIVWGTFAGISPLLIVLRVAMGRGWTRETPALVSHTIMFAPRFDERTGTCMTGDGSGGTFDPSTSTVGAQKIALAHSEKV